MRNKDECEHSEEERALTVAWVSSDLYAALDAGYKLLEIYEVWQYSSFSKWVDPEAEKKEYVPQQQQHGRGRDRDKEKKPDNKVPEGLFTNYIRTFFKTKAESSGWPEEVTAAPSDEVKEMLKKQYIEAVKKYDHVDIDPSKLDTKNKGARTCAKLSMVSISTTKLKYLFALKI